MVQEVRQAWCKEESISRPEVWTDIETSEVWTVYVRFWRNLQDNSIQKHHRVPVLKYASPLQELQSGAQIAEIPSTRTFTARRPKLLRMSPSSFQPKSWNRPDDGRPGRDRPQCILAPFGDQRALVSDYLPGGQPGVLRLLLSSRQRLETR